ncbi:DUF1643 domain-containing protein (plasmid) [Qipengyuania citrea]|mgnify:CR=1 FL=1|uniref:DUF1643 domain-containing protein n=1 Tax=Qipengyuania citrea TaxID=225971 RepID=A0ABY4UAA3_9SPHN|nr:DUF1643 domain-containing protein [Qipengyuania citrea]USA62991.1 DUF1643 domain-containing protein [Qipengyuania citrea]
MSARFGTFQQRDLFRQKAAILSDCGLYRYRLERTYGEGPTVVVVMVNPSTADASQDDATIRRWNGFASRYGWGKIIVVNKFAFRSTDVGVLANAEDPIGPDNDFFLQDAFIAADLIVAAWGTLQKLHDMRLKKRHVKIRKLLQPYDERVFCFGLTKDGQPRHPLMLSYASQLVRFNFA